MPVNSDSSPIEIREAAIFYAIDAQVKGTATETGLLVLATQIEKFLISGEIPGSDQPRE